jgi:hypothetical protein
MHFNPLQCPGMAYGEEERHGKKNVYVPIAVYRTFLGAFLQHM